MSLGENSLVAAYQGKGQLKSRPSGTRVVTGLYLDVSCDVAYIGYFCGELDVNSLQGEIELNTLLLWHWGRLVQNIVWAGNPKYWGTKCGNNYNESIIIRFLIIGDPFPDCSLKV